jgi:hypothetical protein
MSNLRPRVSVSTMLVAHVYRLDDENDSGTRKTLVDTGRVAVVQLDANLN